MDFEIRKLKADDYDQLLDLLNTTFTKASNRPHDFLRSLPKMWIRDDVHMGYHTGAFENERLVGVVGCYPLSVKIGDTSLLFATTGNVATHPDYEGRGIFNALFSKVMEELDSMEADAARLTGARQRYGRFGYEPAGISYEVVINANNRIKYFNDAGADVDFVEIKREDADVLAFCDYLSRKAEFFVERSSEENFRDIYLGLCCKSATPYVALKKGIPIGYLAVAGNNSILELRYISLDYFIPIVCAWQRRINAAVKFKLAPHMHGELRLISPAAEAISVSSPSHFKIMSYDRIANALIKLKKANEPLPCGELVIGIEGYGCISLYVTNSRAGCTRTDKEPDITINRATATRLLFGHLPPSAVIPITNPLISSWLPLPFSWNTLDYV